MPKWGLTEEQRESQPWGIPKKWLLPSKTITDPVHGDIYVNVLECALLDSPPLQRLRRVRQLGTTHLVYPGATHTRLSHGLGTLRAAQDLLDSVVDNRNGPRPAADFFAEWSRSLAPGAAISQFDAELARVTVLVRLGGLLHDLNHVPFGHTIEDDLEVLTSHDSNEDRFDRLWAQLNPAVAAVFADADPSLLVELKMLIVSKKPDGKARLDDAFLYPFCADIVGNTICADLIDYLDRDHKFTGLPISLGSRFKNDFYVSPSQEVHFPKKMVIRVTRHGHERHDVITELLKYLRYRYELSERALAHHAKLGADAMIGKLLEMRSDWLWWEEAAKHEPEAAAKYRKDVGALRDAIREIGGDELVGVVTAAVEHRLEDDFLAYSDDGLLEHLRDWGASVKEDADGRRFAVGQLALDVLNRTLYKGIGRADARHDVALAERIHEKFGKRSPRRQLEEKAARWAGLKHRWGVVIWLPSPKMRLKIAEVLVDYNGRINHLDRIAHERADDIYAAHQSLWGISVYSDETVDDRAAMTLLAYLGESLGVEFLDQHGRPVPGVADLVCQEAAQGMTLGPEESGLLRKQFVEGYVPAHHGDDATYADLLTRARLLAEQIKIAPPA